ncbi:MAG: cell division protein ZapE [Alphaproteobacteria bacterium]
MRTGFDSIKTDKVLMNRGPIFEYRSLVATGTLAPDPAQLLAVEKLQLLFGRLQGYQPGREKGGLRGLMRIGRPDPGPQGLYIFGDVGRGKSMLMDLFFKAAPPEAKKRVHFHAFMAGVHDAIHRWRQDRKNGLTEGDDPLVPVATEIAGAATLLCFDEFQVTDVADAMILKRLFEFLFEAGVVVVATSNTAPQALYKDGLNRPLFLPFIALLEQQMDVLHLEGLRDFRRDRQEYDRYHAPLGAPATRAMDAAWARVAAGHPIAPVQLKVVGRSLQVPTAVGRAARFTFAQICEAPLGASDYLALAEHFDQLLVDDIPQLNGVGRDVVRRLILLIDTAYDAGVELIVSAAAEPDLLYTAGLDVDQFARTASRLHEMGSSDYKAPGNLAKTGKDNRQIRRGKPARLSA